MIALIPARVGSKRLPNKNFRELNGLALWCWTYTAAVESECFQNTVLCTDNEEYLDPLTVHTACNNVVSVFPRSEAPDDQPDIEWVTEFIDEYRRQHHGTGFCAPCSLEKDCMAGEEFAVLRPTSPFRGPETIRRAVGWWNEEIPTLGPRKDFLDSLRAVRVATEPPWKMWRRWPGSGGNLMVPVVSEKGEQSMPTQELVQCYMQTGALEIAWGKTWLSGSLSGERVGMFLTEGPEALDINTEQDWEQAERLASVDA